MALSTFSVAYKQTSDAEFRAWGLAVKTALAAVGLTQTADTGQIDWATVAFPAAGSTKKGYEIWRFSDALHVAGSYVFIRIDYGSGAAAATPSIWFTIGQSTDGAGTITGLTVAVTQVIMGGASTAAGASRVSGASNRMLLALAVDHSVASGGILLSVERTHAADGSDTAEGLLIIWAATAGSRQQAYSMSGGAGTAETTIGVLLPTFGTGSTGTAVALYPIFLSKGVFYNPSANVLVAFLANVTANVQLSFTYYGATKKFMPLDNAKIICYPRGAIAGSAWLVRDE
jgi:hypothetical protein